MEAVTAISKNLLKNTTTAIGVGVIVGLLLGLFIGWVVWPVQWTNATPEVLRSDLQEDYLRMAIESYARTGDNDTALRRWDDLGEAAGPTLTRLQNSPGSLDPAALQQYANLILAAKGQIPTTPTGEAPSSLSTAVIWSVWARFICHVYCEKVRAQ